MSILGTRVVRIEDPRLLTAGGTYVDDLRVPQLTGAARVTFVRSHHGHALFPDAGSNVVVAHPAGDGAFDGCDVVVSRDIVNQRVAPVPMEGRAAAAMWTGGKLTVWVSTQNAQISRFIMAGAFGLDPDAIRVVAPDVGGGFGAKVGIDRDAILVAWAARHTGRALRWVETRSENLVGMTHGRDQQ